MKKRVLLIDESLTVQKVVALTLDRGRYQVYYAKTRAEAMKQILEASPELILVSDQVSDLQAPSFPKEVEVWLGRTHSIPPMILITAEENKEARHYVAVLKKPFSPQTLQTLVARHTQALDGAAPRTDEAALHLSADEYEEQQLQKNFNEAFNDESQLVNETLGLSGAGATLDKGDMTATVFLSEAPRPEGRKSVVPSPDLWSVTPSVAAPTMTQPSAPSRPEASNPMLLGAEDSLAYKATLEKQVMDRIEREDLDALVDKALSRLLPPIVERLVQERLDKLLKDTEQFIE